MSKKVLYLDVETTGMDPLRNDIIQLAAIVEIDGKVVAEKNLKCQPLDWDNVSIEAINISGNTIESLQSYMPPAEAYKEFLALLDSHVDKYAPEDKFYPSGYNLSFDLGFISHFFKKQGNNYWGSYIKWKGIDPLPLLHYLEYRGKISLSNYKLVTVCEYFGIELTAHDALSDAKAVKEILRILEEKFYLTAPSAVI